MDKKYYDKWYLQLNKLVQTEYGINEEQSNNIMDIASTYNLIDACHFFNFLEGTVGLISIWNKEKFITGINTRLLNDFIERH